MLAQSEVTSFRVLPRSSAFFCVLLRSSAAKKRHTHDSFSVCSVVSHGFGLKTALSNKCVRNLPGLKPRLRFLDRANRGRVVPRHSAFFRGQKPPDQRFLSRVFRVLRGERWFPVENTVIEQAHAQLARAKAHATVFGPRNPRSRHSAFFSGQKRLNAKSCAELQTALSELLTAILGGRSSR